MERDMDVLHVKNEVSLTEFSRNKHIPILKSVLINLLT